ncbi:S49 family peptidase [Candidatus Parcubacteria bacterium]|nr:MAG: S49 family peptidase [Candidatus Parcubacteria bacterium]
MPSFLDIEHEVSRLAEAGDRQALDTVRKKYLEFLANVTGRNVIAYYSGWTEPGVPLDAHAMINDSDKHAFMVVMRDLDRRKGLDLILHTPGGDIAATESIVHYLRKMFGNDIRAIIPQIAMSAGTMIACACREIIMGKHSNLGPIDPQMNGVPAQAVLDEFEEAIEQVKRNPASLGIWQSVIGKYHPTFIGECRRAITWSRDIVRGWLAECMFEMCDNPKSKASRVVEKLGDHSETHTHSRHIHVEDCEALGLCVRRLEDDEVLQEAVLSVHHAFIYSISSARFVKLVENHHGLRKGVRAVVA